MNFREFFATNSWWGKIIGAFLGYITTRGPVGALLGVLIGNLFDRGFASHFSNPHLLYHTEKREAVQKAYFAATFAVMGYIAKADGRVSEQEIEMARILMDDMRLSKAQKILAKRLFNEGKTANFRLDSVLGELRRVCRDNRELLKLFVDIQYKAAQVDGLTTLKIKALDTIFADLGFAPLHKQYRFYEDFHYQSSSKPYYEEQSEPEQTKKQSQHRQQNHEHFKQRDSSQSKSSSNDTQQERTQQRQEQANNQYQHYKQQYNHRRQYQPNNLAHAYALLEVSSDSSKQEVKKAYRRLLSRNHPDKLIAQGLPDEMIKLANDKTHKIMKAYELICDNKGWT